MKSSRLISGCGFGRLQMRMSLFCLMALIGFGLAVNGQPADIPEEPVVEDVAAPEESPPAPVEAAPAENPGEPPAASFFYLDGISTRAFIDNVNYRNPADGGNFGIINTSVIIEGTGGATQTIVWRGRGPSINLPVARATNPHLNVARVGSGFWSLMTVIWMIPIWRLLTEPA